MMENNMEQQKKYVNSLVEITIQVISSIWPNSIQYNTDKPVANLNLFLFHILKHSRTTHSTLQLAIFYLFRARSNIQSTNDVYASCGRRMFLASLILAHKYLQDKTYKNVAWSKLSGLKIAEINHSERVMLELLDYQLYVKNDVYHQWLTLLQSQLNIIPPSHISPLPPPQHQLKPVHLNPHIIAAQQSLPSPPLEDYIHLKRKACFEDQRQTKKSCY